MSIEFAPAFLSALADASALKIVATVDQGGVPHLEENSDVDLDAEGRIVLLEQNEYSRTNRNLVHAIWFDRKLSIYVRAGDHSFELVGKPYKAVVSGALFESHYRALRERDGDVSLSTVWLIEPFSITEESPSIRIWRELEGRLPLVHLDRIAR